MLYKNNDKIYLKVSGKFVEVNVKKDKNGYNVVPVQNSKKIEVYGNANKFVAISVEKATDMSNKRHSIPEKLEDELENK